MHFRDHRGLEIKDLRDLEDLTMHGVKPTSDVSSATFLHIYTLNLVYSTGALLSFLPMEESLLNQLPALTLMPLGDWRLGTF